MPATIWRGRGARIAPLSPTEGGSSAHGNVARENSGYITARWAGAPHSPTMRREQFTSPDHASPGDARRGESEDEHRAAEHARARARARWRKLASNMDIAVDAMKPKPFVWTLPSLAIARRAGFTSWGGYAVWLWHVVVWLTALVSWIAIPITVGFEPSSAWALTPLLALSAVATFVFLLDVPIRALTQFAAEGVIVTSPRRAVLRYVTRAWSAIDALAVLPMYEVGIALSATGAGLPLGIGWNGECFKTKFYISL